MITFIKNLFKEEPLNLMVGQFVEVVLKSNVSITNETEEGVFTKVRPMILAGFLSRVGDDYITLGPKKGLISDYIERNEIVHVSVSQQRDEYDEIMEDENAPTGDAGFN